MDPEQLWKLAIGLVICIGLLIAFWAVVLLLRTVYSRKERPSSGPAFTVGELKQMRQAGQISEREYQQLKDKLLGQMDIDARVKKGGR